MAITEHSPLPAGQSERSPRYVRPPQPIHFPSSEEAPETSRHLELRTALYLILQRELGDRATVGSQQFVYFDPTNAKRCLAPDAFLKLGVPPVPFRNWKTWLRGAPDVAVEVVSDADWAPDDWDVKRERYRASGIGEVVRFDPDDTERPIRVWDHIDGDLVERERPDDGAFECQCLQLYWVAVPHAAFGQMLRLSRDRAGTDLLLLPQEAERVQARALQQEARARQEEARAREEEARGRQEEARARVVAEQERDRIAAENAELRKLLAERTAAPSGPRPAKKAKSAKAPRKSKG